MFEKKLDNNEMKNSMKNKRFTACSEKMRTERAQKKIIVGICNIWRCFCLTTEPSILPAFFSYISFKKAV